MKKGKANKRIPAPLGSVETHAPLLKTPLAEQSIFKMMSTENLLHSVAGSYLHFNLVDSYADFPGADTNDGRQLPKDLKGNLAARFERAPEFSAANYYDQSRARTYACCFSLENSEFIWKNYANGSQKGKVCVVFEFGKLRAMLNRTLQPGNSALIYNGNQCRQIFSLDYGLVEYVEWDTHQINKEYLPNPIKYTYLKDKRRFFDEKEFRISLSTLGIGQFALRDGKTLQFPPSLHLMFDIRVAIDNGTIQQILYPPDFDSDFLHAELRKFGIAPRDK